MTISKAISKASCDIIAARALEYHMRVGRVGSIKKHIGRAVQELRPDITPEEARVIIDEIRIIFINRKINHHPNSKRVKKTSETPRPQQLSFFLDS